MGASIGRPFFMPYFDYNSTTPLAPGVLQIFEEHSGLANSSSVHSEGRKARSFSDKCRDSIAQNLGCFPEELIITSHCTESNNTVFNALWNLKGSDKKKILITSVEHDAVLKPILQLEKKGACLIQIPVNRFGMPDLDYLDSQLGDDTLLLSVMLANNETGIRLPVEQMTQMAHERGVLVHTDATCAVGKEKLSFRDLKVDYLSFSGHKFYAPKGIGGLIVKKGAPFEPLFWGGGHERGRRAGTEDVARLVAMDHALSFSLSNLEDEKRRQWYLRKKIIESISSYFPSMIIHEAKQLEHQFPSTLNVSFLGESGLALLAALDLEGVQASYGSACHSGAMEVSRVLLSMGIDEEEAASSLRISFGRMTTEDDVENLIKALKKIL